MVSVKRPSGWLHTNRNGETEPGPMKKHLSAAGKAAIESWVDAVMAARKEYYQKALSKLIAM